MSYYDGIFEMISHPTSSAIWVICKFVVLERDVAEDVG